MSDITRLQRELADAKELLVDFAEGLSELEVKVAELERENEKLRAQLEGERHAKGDHRDNSL